MSDVIKEFYDTVGAAATAGGGIERRSRRSSEEPEIEMFGKPTEISRWGVLNNITFYGVPASSDRLLPGVYTCHHSSSMGYYFSKKSNETDTLLMLPDNASEEVIAEIEEFQGLRPAFKRLGFLYKRGILLFGPPGSGKTTTIQLLIKKVIHEMGGIALYVDEPHTAAECLQLLRQIEPNRQVVMIMEDLDSLVKQYDESGFLSLLDGENQVDNIIFIGTTNYPERLDRRFVDRPSRFDTVKFIGMPNAASRKAFFEYKDPSLTESEVAEFVAGTKGFSVAHLRELVVLTRAFGKPVQEAIARLENMTKRHPTSDDDPSTHKKIGFAARKEVVEN